MTFTFPKDFTWGTATASYQVEGAIHEGGRTASIWDTYCAVPGNILDGSSGEFACDQYHRYLEDIKLMQELGVGAYRLSVAWSRIVPEYGGPVNQEGIDYYRRVLEDLHEAGIKPAVTLYHWDLPQYLEDRGGWVNRETALRFADYVAVLVHEFGDLVDTWITLNEPWCSAYLGYGNGAHAPGLRDHAKALAAVHHLNLAHGLAVKTIRAELGERAKVAITLNLAANVAETDAPEDITAKHRADLMANEVFLGPMIDGAYDPEIFKATKHVTDWSFIQDGDVEIAHQPIDALGINYYSTNHVRGCVAADAGSFAGDRHANAMPAQENVETLPPAGELTAMGWNQEPKALTSLLCELSERWPDLPIVITENGSAWNDEVSEDPAAPGGRIVHDPHRVAYLNAHVQAVADALKAGANVTGYFAWSLLDNFEWAFGYTKRFGIIRVDYDTQARIWKDSAFRFRDIVRANAI